MAVARKLFRLAKWFNEYVTITKTLAGNTPNTDKYLTVATRLAFLLYWIFDNLGVLIKIKFINGKASMTLVLRVVNVLNLLRNHELSMRN